MQLALIYSRASMGMAAPLITVEVHLSSGMAGFHMVGLPEAVVKESKDRVRSAILNARFDFPARKIIVNLAPADLPKHGGQLDLPIALGILAASKQIDSRLLNDFEFTGELALSGELRPVHGVLPMVIAAQRDARVMIVPLQNQHEAGMIVEARARAAKHLLDVCAHLKGEHHLPLCDAPSVSSSQKLLDLIDVRGQRQAKRALVVAASGGHSLLMVGPPGTGKTMLAARLPSLLPSLTDTEAVEVATIASMSSRGFHPDEFRAIPFRAPHHSASSVALVGGGRPPKPGEISLAHRGVLFLDELPEFERRVLEALREPLESGHVVISRAAYQMQFPASFQLIAAMNPCPCGFYGSNLDRCECSSLQIKRYTSRLSGPLLDRIDMQILVPKVPLEWLEDAKMRDPSESSEALQIKVRKARERQLLRQGKVNALLRPEELSQVALFREDAKGVLSQALEKLQLSARVYHRMVKLALTLSDLAEVDRIRTQEISEALQYRVLDKGLMGGREY